MLIFDNGSCPEVQEELRRMQASGFIHFLLLSRFNVGKTGALNWILAALPNELIGFADGDVLFRPGWLEKTMPRFFRRGRIWAWHRIDGETNRRHQENA